MSRSAVFLRVDMEKYAAVSRRIIAILRNLSPLVEQASLDEGLLRCVEVLDRLHGEGFSQFRTVVLAVRFEDFETKTRPLMKIVCEKLDCDH